MDVTSDLSFKDDGTDKMNIRVGRAKLYINSSVTGFNHAAAGPLTTALQIPVWKDALTLTAAAALATASALAF